MSLADYITAIIGIVFLTVAFVCFFCGQPAKGLYYLGAATIQGSLIGMR